jgi:hypothetical protein
MNKKKDLENNNKKLKELLADADDSIAELINENKNLKDFNQQYLKKIDIQTDKINDLENIILKSDLNKLSIDA